MYSTESTTSSTAAWSCSCLIVGDRRDRKSNDEEMNTESGSLTLISLCVFPRRLLLVLLDSVLCGSHDASSVRDVQHPTRSDEHRHVAGLREQCTQPHHLHRLQHGVQEILQESVPELLLTRVFISMDPVDSMSHWDGDVLRFGMRFFQTRTGISWSSHSKWGTSSTQLWLWMGFLSFGCLNTLKKNLLWHMIHFQVHFVSWWCAFLIYGDNVSNIDNVMPFPFHLTGNNVHVKQ